MADDDNVQSDQIVEPDGTDLSPEGEIAQLGDGLQDIFTSDEPDDDLPKGDTGNDDVDGDKPAPQPEGDGEEYEYIPDEQVAIARQLGYSDDEIISLAETNPRVLEDMVKLQGKPQRAEPQRAETPAAPESKPADKLDHVDIPGLDKLPPEAQSVVAEMLKTQNALIDRINAQNEQLAGIQQKETQKSQEDAAAYSRKIDSYFDGVSKDLPDVGDVSKGNLTDAQAKNRMEIYGVAHMLQETRGLGLDEALDEASYMWAISRYDLKDLEKQAEDRVREKLNSQKKKFSPRPGGRKSEKKYKNIDDEAMDTLTTGMREIFD